MNDASTDPAELLPDAALARAAAAHRLDDVRTLAAALGLDGTLAFAWRRGVATALTGFSPGFVTNWASVWIPVDGEPVLGVRFPFECERAAAQSGIAVCHAASPAAVVPAGVEWVGVICGDSAVREGHQEIETELRLRGVASTDLTAWFDARREVKSAHEVTGLRSAALVGQLALAAAAATMSGDTDFQIAARVEGRARVAGATRADCLVGIGRGAVVTEAFGALVGAADPVGLELNMVHGGFFAHVQATVLPPVPDAIEVRAVRVARSARNAVRDALRPGVRIAEAVARGESVLRGEGLLADLEYDFGHGIGYDTPEHPRLLSSSDRTVELGSVIAVHCGLRRPHGETAYTGGPVLVGASVTTDLVEDPIVTVTRRG